MAVAGPMWMDVLLSLILLLGGRDVASYLDPAAYWQAKGVEFTAARLLQVLQTEKSAAPAGLKEAIAKLGAGTSKERREAREAILAAGPEAACPLLQPLVQSDDPELAQSARELIAQLQQTDVRNDPLAALMAVRGLGVLKDPTALPKLRQLQASKVPFLAEYATAAIAAIEGKDAPKPVAADPAATDKLLHLLPARCALVARVAPIEGLPVESLIGMMTQGARGMGGGGRIEVNAQVNGQVVVQGQGNAQMQIMVDGKPVQPNAAVAAPAASPVQRFLEKSGNARLHGALFGFDAGVRFFVVIITGEFDAQRAVEGVAASLRFPRVEGEQPGKLVVFGQRDVLLAALDDHTVLFGAHDGRREENFPLAEIVAARDAGKGGLANNAAMMALVAKADQKAVAWGVVQMSEKMKQEAREFNGVDEAIAAITAVEDKLVLRLTATGADAAALGANVDQLTRLIGEGQREVGQMVQHVPAMKPLADVMQSLRLEKGDKSATFTATASKAALLSFPMLFLGVRVH